MKRRRSSKRGIAPHVERTHVYVDGASDTAAGGGAGWGAVLVGRNGVAEAFCGALDGIKGATQAKVAAVSEALKRLRGGQPQPLKVVTDCRAVADVSAGRIEQLDVETYPELARLVGEMRREGWQIEIAWARRKKCREMAAAHHLASVARLMGGKGWRMPDADAVWLRVHRS